VVLFGNLKTKRRNKMVERTPNEIKIIDWFMQKKAVIKFNGDDTTYKLSETVIKASNFEKFPLQKGDKVEVAITDGVVTFLRKQKSDAPKAESHGSEEAYEPTPEEEAGPTPKVEQKVEAPKIEAPTSDAKELTVYAIAANKKVVKFLEIKDDGWYQIAENIQAMNYDTIGLKAKNKVKVVFNDKTITYLAKVASEPAEQPKTATSSQGDVQSERIATPATTQAPKKEWKPSSSYDTAEKQTSIEAQAAVNSACEVAAKVAAAITTTSRKDDGTIAPPTANVINNIIRAIAESNFALIQELKSK
jgi:hypothetical protein